MKLFYSCCFNNSKLLDYILVEVSCSSLTSPMQERIEVVPSNIDIVHVLLGVVYQILFLQEVSMM